MEQASPIFIHSLFRSGSTYLFNVFRRSEAGYWCYQEPLNERLVYNATKPGGFLVGVEGAHKILRHPELTKPHNYEYHVVSDEVVKLFDKKFSYQQFFENSPEQLKEQNAYFHALINGAKGRAVLQCCRTTGRVAPLKEEFGGVHIFLWRNPWDQWWSYKQDAYFDSRNLFISGADKLPDFLAHIKKQLKIPEFNNVNQSIKDAYFTNRRLDASSSYILFYSLWCHAMLEARPKCHFSISIDKLSGSDSYRDEIIATLNRHGIEGINLFDSSVAMTTYGEDDGLFFKKAEDFVHSVLLKYGYSVDLINELVQLAIVRNENLVNTEKSEYYAVRDAMRARDYARLMETKLSEMQNQLFHARTQAQQAEAKIKAFESKKS